MSPVLQMLLFVLIISGLALFSMRFPMHKRVAIDCAPGYVIERYPNIFLVLIILAALVVISGDRGLAYEDTGSYTYQYLTFLSDDFFKAWNNADSSNAFWAFSALIKNLTDVDMNKYLLIFSIATLLPILFVFYKYSERFDITVFLFLAMGSYLVTLNAMRQCVASAIMFLGYRFFIKKKWYVFFIFVGIAYFFHPTSIVMIPIYFYCQRPAWSPVLTLLVVVVAFAFAFVPSLSGWVFNVFGETDYTKYDTMSGTNIIRPLIMIGVCILAFRCRENLKVMYPQSNALVNMLVVHTVFLVMATNSWIFARLCIFTDLYVEILIPMIIYASFREKDRPIYTTVLVLFFLAYHIYEYRGLNYYSTILGINA